MKKHLEKLAMVLSRCFFSLFLFGNAEFNTFELADDDVFASFGDSFFNKLFDSLGVV